MLISDFLVNDVIKPLVSLPFHLILLLVLLLPLWQAGCGSCCISSSVLLFQATQFLAIHSDSTRSCLSIDIFVLFLCCLSPRPSLAGLSNWKNRFHLAGSCSSIWHKECLVYIICIHTYKCISIYKYIYQLYKPIDRSVESINSLESQLFLNGSL